MQGVAGGRARGAGVRVWGGGALWAATHTRTRAPPRAGAERTWNFKQADIVGAVEVGAARKAFDLALPQLGPYAVDFSRSGRHALLGGRWGSDTCSQPRLHSKLGF